MKTKNTITTAIAVAIGALVPCLASAVVVGPYSTADANTLHLWHLDDSGTQAVDEAHYNYTGTFTTNADVNLPLTALYGSNSPPGATLGNASYTGFGTALSTAPTNTVLTTGFSGVVSNQQPGLGAKAPTNSTLDNVDHTFDNPTTHAFTMEAILKIGFNPSTNWASPMEIIAGEGDAGDSSDRSWQFRIEAHNNLAIPWVLRFQKLSGFGGIGGSTGNDSVDGNIPTNGVNAIEQGSWYHVAVTYDGSITNVNGLKLYWTKLDDANTTAAVLTNGDLNGWLREQDTDFSLGNEQRDFNGQTEPFAGLIDEVRISDIARTADQFIFAVPEPSTFVLMGAGLGFGALLLRRKRTRT